MKADEFFLIDNSGLKRQATCRLLDDFRSVNRKHIGKKGYIAGYNLWFGSMVHKALEELEGRNAFNGDVRATVLAWYNSFLDGKDMYDADGNMDLTAMKKYEDEIFRPQDSEDTDVDLATGMIENYFEFLKSRNIEWETVILDGKPAVEVPFYVKLDLETPEGKPVVFRGTIDRIVKDGFDNYYFVDYKTRSRFTNQTLSVDPQVMSYLSMAEVTLPFDIKGMYFVQLMKDLPKEPRLLKQKKNESKPQYSTDKSQRTTYDKMSEALIERFGSLKNIPKKYDKLLAKLDSNENPMDNRFFDIKEIGLPETAKDICIENIYLQAEVMISKDYKIFPSAGQHCEWCAYRDLCQITLIGGDVDEIINREYEEIPDRYNLDENKQEARYEAGIKEALNG